MIGTLANGATRWCMRRFWAWLALYKVFWALSLLAAIAPPISSAFSLVALGVAGRQETVLAKLSAGSKEAGFLVWWCLVVLP